jgi:NAD(P)-dependent dehydrogenase (short-subunit alcohol dehydrogenase family)
MKASELFSLKGLTALVTGGAGHLGSPICEVLSQAGARVVVASRNHDNCQQMAHKLQNENGVPAWGLSLDIQDSVSVRSCIDETIRLSGSLDILVNNAAFYAGMDLETMSEEEWLGGLDGTINHVFRCTQAVIPPMKQAKRGCIINITSMYGMVSPDPALYGDSGLGNPPNYGAGKAAVLQFTRYCACYLGRYGIRVNAISPGPFPNPQVQVEHPWFIDRLAAKNPMGRIGQSDELKGAVVYLASEAAAYVTGANLVVDGGWTAW